MHCTIQDYTPGFAFGLSNKFFNKARRTFITNRIFQFFDFLDPASVFEVPGMALLIPEVWDFYRLSGASFFFIIILRFFIDFSLLSSPGYSLSSPGGPPDRKKKIDFS